MHVYARWNSLAGLTSDTACRPASGVHLDLCVARQSHRDASKRQLTDASRVASSRVADWIPGGQRRCNSDTDAATAKPPGSQPNRFLLPGVVTAWSSPVRDGSPREYARSPSPIGLEDQAPPRSFKHCRQVVTSLISALRVSPIAKRKAEHAAVSHLRPWRSATRSIYGASRVVETGSAYGVNCRIGVDTSTRISAPRRASPTNCRASPDQNLPGS